MAPVNPGYLDVYPPVGIYVVTDPQRKIAGPCVSLDFRTIVVKLACGYGRDGPGSAPELVLVYVIPAEVQRQAGRGSKLQVLPVGAQHAPAACAGPGIC